MSARKIKARVCRRLASRFHSARQSFLDELWLWEYTPPVGMEFGSPAFDALMQQAPENGEQREGHDVTPLKMEHKA